jgi:hypothetical protein
MKVLLAQRGAIFYDRARGVAHLQNALNSSGAWRPRCYGV